MYESLEGLRVLVETSRDDGMRQLFEHHRTRITSAFASSGVSATETTLAGFLNGFLTAALRLADDTEAMADTIEPYLGGIYLSASDALDRLARPSENLEFLARLTDTLANEAAYRDLPEPEQAQAVKLVEDVFAETPDVPLNADSLTGFALGVLYAAPFIARSPGAASAALLGAVIALARRG